MSADEIRGLAESVSKHRADVIPCLSDDVYNALLSYATMVERCERLIRPCNLEDAPCVPSDTGYCDSCDGPRHNDMINYILKGETNA